ncbi:hypothetical protein KKA95_05170 [Patescibacteria group bacterium]|nr:hypothetical protein [Patescibacteria group bacterium]
MGIEGPSTPEIDPEVLEAFKTDLNDAVEFVKEFEASTPLQNLPSFESLVGSEIEMIEILMEKFAVNPNTDKAIRQYLITDSQEREKIGNIQVRVFATNDPDVFLGQYTDSNGSVDWTIRPLEGEE